MSATKQQLIKDTVPLPKKHKRKAHPVTLDDDIAVLREEAKEEEKVEAEKEKVEEKEEELNRPALLTTTSVRKRVAASTKKPRKNQRAPVVVAAARATPATLATSASPVAPLTDPLQEYAVPLADIILATTKYPRRCMLCHVTTWLCSRDTIIECSSSKCQHPVLYKPRHMTIETFDADL